MKSKKKKILIIFTGVAGSGKSTVLKLLAELLNLIIAKTATTRPPRTGEIHGKHYLFIGEKEFDKWDKEGKLIERSPYRDNHYGLPISSVTDPWNEGKIASVCMDPNGVLNNLMIAIKRGIFSSHKPDLILIVNISTEMENIMDRLAALGLSPDDMAQRMVEFQRDQLLLNRLENLTQETMIVTPDGKILNPFRLITINDDGKLDDVINTLRIQILSHIQ